MLARMRRLPALLLPLCLIACQPAGAAEPGRSSSWQLERYAAARAGLRLEERCRALPEAARRELGWHVQRIEEGLRALWDAESLHAVAAPPEPRDCEGAAASAEQALATAREFSAVLGGPLYSAEALQLADATRLARLLLTQRLDDRCRLIAPPRREAFDADVETLRARFATEAPGYALDQFDAFADRLAGGLRDGEPAISCLDLEAMELDGALGEAHRAARW